MLGLKLFPLFLTSCWLIISQVNVKCRKMQLRRDIFVDMVAEKMLLVNMVNLSTRLLTKVNNGVNLYLLKSSVLWICYFIVPLHQNCNKYCLYERNNTHRLRPCRL